EPEEITQGQTEAGGADGHESPAAEESSVHGSSPERIRGRPELGPVTRPSRGGRDAPACGSKNGIHSTDRGPGSPGMVRPALQRGRGETGRLAGTAGCGESSGQAQLRGRRGRSRWVVDRSREYTNYSTI